MSTKVAGFAVQDPTSPLAKVYAAFAYRDTAGTFHVVTAYGGDSEWVVKRFRRVQNRTEPTADAAQKALTELWNQKTRKGYDRTLAGPVAFDVPVTATSTIDPTDLVRALNNESPVLHSGAAAVARAFGALLGTTATPSPTAAAAPRAADRTRIMLPSHEVDGIALPNGKMMYSREVAGHSDVAMLRHLRDQARSGGPKLYVRLYGPAGGGKSTIPLGAFGDELVAMNGHGDMTVAHFVGQQMPQADGTWQYVDGPLARAMLEGRPFHLDEASRVPSETMAILLSVADSRGVLHRDDLPGTEPIRAQPGFFMVISYNEAGMGVRRLDDAIKRRFPIAIEVSADFTAAEAAGVNPLAVSLARNMQAKSLEDRGNGGLGYWVPQIADLLVFQQVLDAGLGLAVAASSLVSACTDPESLETLDEEIKTVLGMDAEPLALGSRVIVGAP